MTNGPPIAIVRPSRSAEVFIVEPGAGASIRRLEHALSKSGLGVVFTREGNGVYVPRTYIGDVVQTLSRDWECRMAPEMMVVLAELKESEAMLKRGRLALRMLDSSSAASAFLEDFDQTTVLDDHQLRAVAILSHSDVQGLCLFDEQGLGKTVTAICAFHRLRQLNRVSRMLVLAPKNMLLEWVRDFERFMGSRYSVAAVSGSQAEKRVTLDESHDVLVVNFEAAVSMEVRLRDLLLAEKERAFLVVDESFFVKNSEARRTRAVRRLRQNVRRCLVLCGTPAPNRPHDIVEQFNIADGGIAFRGVELPEDSRAARVAVQNVLETRGIYLRRLKEDVLPHLPGKTFHTVLVPMSPVQAQVYVAALKALISDLRSVDEVAFRKEFASFLARRSGLLQICSCPASVVDGYDETPGKLLALDSIIDDLVVRKNEKVIVWSFFTASIDALVDRYRVYRPVRFDGTITRSEDRRSAVRQFQEDNRTMLFIANPAAAGAGLTLHRARFAIYESMSNQAAHYLQSLDRIHRRGQERKVEYIILLCDRTLEIREYERLREKEMEAQQLLGDVVKPPVTREVMLAEAMNAAAMIGLDGVLH